jgi:HSP20 family molecular chaperone IbpA
MKRRSTMLSSFSRNGRLALESPFQALHDTLSRAACVASDEVQPHVQGYERTAVYPVDIREDQTSFHVEAELPGFTRDQVQVTLDKGVLEIVATRGTPAQAAPQSGQAQPEVQGTSPEASQAQPQPAREETHLRERRYTRVARAFKLPPSIDESKIQARLENGVLYLTIQKREESKPRKIQIN